MRLVDLNPRFYGYGGDGVLDAAMQPIPRREGVGLMCDCPCGQCGEAGWLAVDFANPLDGKPPPEALRGPKWQREGDTFETLTLSPSILRSREKGGCGWHGWIRNGEVLTA